MTTNNSDFELTLPSDREIKLTRRFDAPRALVWAAWTRPEHLARWYGCSAVKLTVCEIDLRVGGAWRFVMRAPDGTDHTLQGEYREVEPVERLVHTQRYVTAGFESNAAEVSVILTEQDGGTRFTSIIRHGSREDRDMHLKSGMETGAAESLERLDQHLGTLQPA